MKIVIALVPGLGAIGCGHMVRAVSERVRNGDWKDGEEIPLEINRRVVGCAFIHGDHPPAADEKKA